MGSFCTLFLVCPFPGLLIYFFMYDVVFIRTPLTPRATAYEKINNVYKMCEGGKETKRKLGVRKKREK